jgi:hypothetical protein
MSIRALYLKCSDMVRGRFPAGIDPWLLHLTGTIVSWWGRVEGILVGDLMLLRQHPKFLHVAQKERFPIATKRIIEQWGRGRRIVCADDALDLKRLDRALFALRECANERNDLVHGFWPYGAEPDAKTLRLEIAKPSQNDAGDIEIRHVEIDAERLDKLNERIIDLYHGVLMMSVNLHILYPHPALAKGHKGE